MSFPITVPTMTPYRADTFVMSYIFKEGEPLAPIDLVTQGWTGWVAQWRTTPDSDTFIAFTVDATQANVGRINLSMTPAQTVDLDSGVWDLQATRGVEVRTWIRGNLKVIEDVTRG